MILNAADKTTLNLPIFSHTWPLFQIRVVSKFGFEPQSHQDTKLHKGHS